MITEKAAVMAEFTTASFQLNAWEANCGTEDNIPKKMELIQMTACEIFIFCCCMTTADFKGVKIVFLIIIL